MHEGLEGGRDLLPCVVVTLWVSGSKSWQLWPGQFFPVDCHCPSAELLKPPVSPSCGLALSWALWASGALTQPRELPLVSSRLELPCVLCSSPEFQQINLLLEVVG